MESTTLTLMGIFANFAISYAANNVPTLRELINRKSGLDDRIEECFEKALKRWSINSGVRGIEKSRMNTHLQDLQKVLEGNEIPESYQELIKYWIEELKTDSVCYDFVIENKIEIQNVKLTQHLEFISDQIKAGFESNQQQLSEALSGIEEIKKILSQRESSEENKAAIEALIVAFLNVSITNLVNRLLLDSAKQLLKELESSLVHYIEENPIIAAKVALLKGMADLFSSPQKALKLFHEAYNLYPKEEIIIEKECYTLLYEGKTDEALKLSEDLPSDNVIRNVAGVLASKDIVASYQHLPDELKSNNNLRYEILSIRGNKDQDTAFLFDGTGDEPYESLTYQNVFGWLYGMTCHNVNLDGMLFLVVPPNLDINKYNRAFEYAKIFYSHLCKTEIERHLKMVHVNYCYWGYVLDQHPSWVDEILKMEPRELDRRQEDLVLTQTSMLMMSKRYSEAFTNLASIKDKINVAIANYVVLMGYHSMNTEYLRWIFEVRKHNEFLFNSDSSRYIAFCINKSSGQEIEGILVIEAFEDKNNYVVLSQLCRHHTGKRVDVDLLKNSLEGLSDDMIAYAAMVLSEHGEEKLAFKLLSPKVDEKTSNVRQRIFLDILNKLPEEKPHLYRLLKENRKSGEMYDTPLLEMEYHLSMRVADYENAYEVVSILYNQYPQEENAFTNYLKLTGRLYPQKLSEYESKAISFKYDSFQNVIQLYRLFGENNYYDTAAEILYRNVKDSSDWGIKTFYTQESSLGHLANVVRKKYDEARAGLYVLCSLPDGQRVLYEAGVGNEVGEQLLGCKDGDELSITIEGNPVTITVVSILNIYGKLEFDLMQENLTGANPFMKPFTIDENRPLESLEELLKKIDPDSVNYHQSMLQQQEAYENGEIGIAQLVNGNEIIEGYYDRLYASSKVFVAPCQMFDEVVRPQMVRHKISYVLDLTAIIMLFEYQQSSGCQYNEKFLISATTYEYIVSAKKNCRLLSMIEFSHAISSGILKRYNKLLWADVEIRMSKLVKWMDENCDKVFPEKALSLDNMPEKSEIQVLLANTVSLLLNEPTRCLVTDDHAIEMKLRGLGFIISTEAYMKYKDGGRDYKSYCNFLIRCNYIGVNLTKEFIVTEYKKMELAQPNKINYIMQNASHNAAICANILNAGFQIVTETKDISLARITITNMFVAMIKSLRNDLKSELITNTLSRIPYQYWNTRIVKMCLTDAARICNVIILPGYNTYTEE